MDGSFELTSLIISAIVAGVAAQVLAKLLRVPSIVFLLLFGVTLGKSGLNAIEPRLLGPGLETIVALSVALILFEGGLNLQLGELGKVSTSLRNLISIGALVALIGGGIAAHYLAEFPWPLAFLYASLVVVTGPTVINPILKEVGIDRRVATILEGEGVLIDAIGAVLAVVVLDVVLRSEATAVEVAIDLVVRLGIGAVVGSVGGWLLGLFLKGAAFLSEDVKGAVVVAAVLGMFGFAQSIETESGLMAVVLAGIVVRSAGVPDERLLLRFKGQLALLTTSVLFILLAANLSIQSLFALGRGGVLTVLAVMFVVRPVVVGISTWNSTLNLRQKAFLVWCAPRGIVAASVASLFAILLTERGVNGGEAVKALVFLTIAMTVFLEGLTARWIAQLLRLRMKDASGIAIVGGNDMGLLLARLFQQQGERVTLLDSSVETYKRATALAIPAFLGNGLDMDALAEAGLDEMGTLVVLTINTDVNLAIAQRALEEFRPPRVYAVYVKQEEDNGNGRSEIRQAFGNRVPLKTWNQYIRQQEIQIGEVTLDASIETQLAHFNSMYGAGRLLPMLVERRSQLQLVAADMTWEPGDRIVYLWHRPRLLAPAKPELPDVTPTPLEAVDVERNAIAAVEPVATIEISSQTLGMEPKRTVKADSTPGDVDVYLDMARDILSRLP